MANPLFEPDALKKLPLWGQVLIAARTAKRAAYALPVDVDEALRAAYVGGCEAAERCAALGARPKAERAAMESARDREPGVRAAEAAQQALYWATDAAHAAEDSLDFSAAETACVNSAQTALAWAMDAPGLSPLQVRLYVAADVDTVRFACAAAGVDRYGGLGAQVMGRLAPVYPPDVRTPARAGPVDTDPTGGAR